VGAGVGLPGLALKIARPDISLFLIEATGKKTEFLSRTISTLGLDEVDVLCIRAEDASRDPALRESFDIAVIRALARLAVVLEYGLPLVRIGGRLIAYKAERVEEELVGGEKAAISLGGRIEEVQDTVVPFLNAKRCLVLAKKEQRTEERFPRRTGVPGKRPLG
ncbi:MAG: 16S rRNA (guanine(527)-N(7))-methyltransferase RsmG, partial [Chloroflexi bacterium]|nr:16S rRNA (guanine(527)-N(7))-methyltransferase RsmG [Chloroflexota bacterium]